MITVDSDMMVMFDVDQTLLIWSTNEENNTAGDDKIEIIDPYNNSTYFLRPHIEHIRLMQKYKVQGYTITVWSAAGYKWASEAVKQLGIEHLVDFVMPKPNKYVDDLKADEILGSRVYIPYNQKARVIEPGEQE